MVESLHDVAAGRLAALVNLADDLDGSLSLDYGFGSWTVTVFGADVSKEKFCVEHVGFVGALDAALRSAGREPEPVPQRAVSVEEAMQLDPTAEEVWVVAALDTFYVCGNPDEAAHCAAHIIDGGPAEVWRLPEASWMGIASSLGREFKIIDGRLPR